MTTAVAALLGLTTSSESRGDTYANFWLSNVDAGPVVPLIYALPGSTGHIDVRARPAVGYRLDAFSLDLEAQQAGVITFTGVDVLNPLLDDSPDLYRHQLTFDSSNGLFVAPSLIDSFLGFSLFDDAIGLDNGAGIGPMCGLDPECSAASGSPTWRIATIHYQASLAFGATELFLEIGEHGLWQSPAGASEADPPWNTSAIFGLEDDTPNQWTVPDIGGADHRHDAEGLADAVIRVASADFNADGKIDGADFLVWQRGLGVGTLHSEGDADGDGGVDRDDLAVWRFQYGAKVTLFPIGLAVPEPAGMVAAAILLMCGHVARGFKCAVRA